MKPFNKFIEKFSLANNEENLSVARVIIREALEREYENSPQIYNRIFHGAIPKVNHRNRIANFLKNPSAYDGEVSPHALIEEVSNGKAYYYSYPEIPKERLEGELKNAISLYVDDGTEGEEIVNLLNCLKEITCYFNKRLSRFERIKGNISVPYSMLEIEE